MGNCGYGCCFVVGNKLPSRSSVVWQTDSFRSVGYALSLIGMGSLDYRHLSISGCVHLFLLESACFWDWTSSFLQRLAKSTRTPTAGHVLPLFLFFQLKSAELEKQREIGECYLNLERASILVHPLESCVKHHWLFLWHEKSIASR